MCPGPGAGARARQSEDHGHGDHGGGHAAQDVADGAQAALSTGVGPEAVEDGGLELEGNVVAPDVVGVGGGQDPGQTGQLVAVVPTGRAAVEMGAQGQTVLLVELPHDLEGQQAVPVVAPVGRHWSHPISSSVRRSDWRA